MTKRILIAGGHGTIGSTIARLIRGAGHDAHLVLAGRNPDKGQALARELGNASVASCDVDVASGAAGLPAADLIISALYDPRGLLLEAALERGSAHIGITYKADDVAPAMSAAMSRAPARPIVLLGHSMAGVATLAALQAARRFTSVDSVAVTGLFDPLDTVGPMTAGDAEALVARALVRENGRWAWVDGTRHPRSVRLSRGEMVEAYPTGLLDAPSLAAVTGAANVRLDLAQGSSLGTRRSGKASSDVYVDIEGVLPSGETARSRTVLNNPGGLMHLTALGVVVAAERVLGLDGQVAPAGGLYLPETLLAPDAAVTRLEALGVRVSAENAM